jgi:UDP:flavonoid glycosyltransferase YjiC (YdhE family)
MPYSHDQPDNAARCRRLGVAEIVTRSEYDAEKAAEVLAKILSDETYRKRASEVAEIVRSEPGTAAACDAVEEALAEPSVLRKSLKNIK